MNWPDLSMGGYGFYVWGSYLVSLIAIVWEVVSLKQRKKALTHTAPSAVAPGQTPIKTTGERTRPGATALGSVEGMNETTS